MTAAEKAEVAMRILNERFGGAAQAQLNTFLGMWQKMRNYMGDLAEAIGYRIIPSFVGLFDTITDKVKAAIAVVESGRFDTIFEGWFEAAKSAVEVFSNAIATAAPIVLTAVGKMGDAVAEFMKQLDAKRIAKWTKELVNMGKKIGNLSASIVKLTAQHWKLIAALAGLMVLSNVIVKVLAFSKAILGAVVAIKAWTVAVAAGTAGVAGPLGLAAAIGLATGLLINYAIKTAEARREQERLNRVQTHFNNIMKIIEANTSTNIEAIKKLNAQIDMEKDRIADLRDEMARYISTLRKLPEGWGYGVVERGIKKEIERLHEEMESGRRLIAKYSRELRKLREAIRVVPTPTGAEIPLGAPPPGIDTGALSEEMIKQQEQLQREVERLTLSEFEFKRRETQRWVKDQSELAKGNQIILSLIKEAEKLKFAQIEADKTKFLKDQVDKRNNWKSRRLKLSIMIFLNTYKWNSRRRKFSITR